MKTLVIYSSQTGFTERYAGWIAEEVTADRITIKEAKKKPDSYYSSYDAIVYGGWSMGGKLVNLDWFLEKATQWKDKKLAVYGVGATPEDAPEIKEFIDAILDEEHRKNMQAFYCPGGLNYAKMNIFCRVMMKMFAKSLSKKEGLSEYEKHKARVLLTSFDISDRKFITPIVAYLNIE